MPFINVWLAMGTYGQLGQGIAHTLISYNRFTAIVQPLEYKKVSDGHGNDDQAAPNRTGAGRTANYPLFILSFFWNLLQFLGILCVYWGWRIFLGGGGT